MVGLKNVVFFEVNEKGLLELYVIRIINCTNHLLRWPVGGLVKEVVLITDTVEYCRNEEATLYSSKKAAQDVADKMNARFVGVTLQVVKLIEVAN